MPNILLILTDDQRALPDGAGNDLLDVMPNLQTNVVDRGTHFPNYHISSPICAPSRVTTYSGLYASQHGVWTVNSGDADNWNEYFSFVRILQTAGWRTGIIGKFNNFFSAADARWFDYNFPITSLSSPTEISDLFDAAETFITDPDPRPWFLSWCPHVPHDPYVCSPVGAYTPPTFTAATAAFEADASEKVPPHSVGATARNTAEDAFDGQMEECAALDEIIDDLFGLFTGPELDATAVIFTSDNGYMWAEHGMGEKEVPYRESTNVPFYLAWPNGGVEEGDTDARLCSNIDLAPTILDIASHETGDPGDVAFDYEAPGRSFLLPGSGHPDWIYIEAPEGATTGVGPWRGIREADRLYVEYTDEGAYEDYATDADPTEEEGSSGVDSTMQARLEALPWQESGLMSALSSEPEELPSQAMVVFDPVPEPTVGDEDAYLELSTNSGLTDRTGNEHHGYGYEGLEVGDSVDSPPGMVGSTTFDGVTNYIELTGYEPLTSTGTVTMCVWVKRAASNTGSFQPIFHTQTYSLRFDDNNATQVTIREGAALDNLTLPNDLVGAWHLIALEVNRSLNRAKVFLDGAQLGTNQVIAGSALTTNPVMIGGMPVDNTVFYGQMTRFSLYTRALTTAEHAAKYQSGITAVENVGSEMVLSPEANGIILLEEGLQFPINGNERTYADAPVMEGRYRTRTKPTNPEGQGRVRISGDTEEEFLDRMDAFQDKIAQLDRNGGVLAYTPSADGARMYYDIVATSIDPDTDVDGNWASRGWAILNFSFECRPYGRLDPVEITTSENIEDYGDSIPISDVAGHVDALGELTVTTAAGEIVDDFEWGIDENSDAELVTAGSLLVTSGYAGTIVGAELRGTVGPDYIAYATTPELGHVGRYRVKLRGEFSSTDMRTRLVWHSGDAPYRTNQAAAPHIADEHIELDLGVVNIVEMQGDQAWSGRIEVKGPVGEDFVVHRMLYIPAERYGRALGSQIVTAPNSPLAAADDFDSHTAGTLIGKTAQLGGAWTESGDTTDFFVNEDQGWAYRDAVSDADANTGQYARLGSAAPTQTDISVDFVTGTVSGTWIQSYSGVFLRYVDTNNWLMAVYIPIDPNTTAIELRKRVSGSVTTLGSAVLGFTSPNIWRTLRVVANTSGDVTVIDGARGGPADYRIGILADANLATGGALDNGGFGIYDANLSASTAVTRFFDNFHVSSSSLTTVSTSDRVIYPAQSLRLDHTSCQRENSAGTRWGDVPNYQGRRLYVPPATRQNNTSRLVIKHAENDLTKQVVTSGGTLSAALTVTPRVLLTG